MELETLRIFCVVAEEQSVTRAAIQLKRAQSNVTTRIQLLEADLRVELFVRSGRRMRLSTAGQHLFGYAQQLLALADTARQVVSDGCNGGRLKVGGMECTAACHLSSIFASYLALYPSTQIEFRSGTSRQLLEQLRIGQLDCAFLALPLVVNDVEALNEIGLRGKVMWREELMLLLSASETHVASASDLRARSLAVLAPGCAYRDFAQKWLSSSGLSDWKTVEVASYHSMSACVATGECFAFLPSSVLGMLGEQSPFTSMQVGQMDTWLVWRQGGKHRCCSACCSN